MIIVGDVRIVSAKWVITLPAITPRIEIERRSCKTKQIQRIERPYYVKHLLLSAKSGFRSLP